MAPPDIRSGLSDDAFFNPSSDQPKDRPHAADLQNNPLLSNAQHTLKEQLLDRKRVLEEQLREKSFALKNATKKREDAGVKMYGLQKTLATLLASLTSASEHLSAINAGHMKADEELSQYQKQHAVKLNELNSQREKMEKMKEELNGLGETLKQIEKHNEKLKSDLAISRRVTYSTEDELTKAEKDKRDQDLLIAHLEDEKQRHLDKKELILAKLTAQKRETQVARDALSEAQIEMESINAEKKQIMSQWKSSLVVLTRSNEALQGLNDAIQKQNEQETAIQGEKDSIKKAIKKEHSKVEQQVGTLTAIENRIKVSERKMQQVVAKRLKILEEYTVVLLSVQEAEVKVDKVEKETAVINTEIKEVEKKLVKESEELIVLEDGMLKSLGDQVTLERSHQKLVHKIMDIRKKIKKEDMIATELEFEHSQIRNDLFKVASYNQNVREALESLESEIKQKLLIVSKMDSEIKRKQSDIDVKSKEIDRLNKQYEKLTANFVDKDQTPWDHMIANITYEITTKAKASTQLQKQWLTMQSDLVNLTANNNALSEKIQKLESDKVSLVQRNKRLEKELTSLKKNIKDLDNSMKVNHNMIVRFNDLIAKNTILQNFLENENFNAHANHMVALKDLENDLVKLEVSLEDTIKERDEVSEDVAELQHHIKLWTSKIAFEKQTQDTFMKAIVGPMAMTTALRKELDRLKLKLENVKCTRDRLLSNVEMRVSNRKAIFVKVQAVSQNKTSSQHIEEAMHVKLVGDLRRQIRDVGRHTEALEGRFEDLQTRKEFLGGEIEGFNQSINKMIGQQEQLRVRLKEASSKRIYLLLATTFQQRMVKRHSEFKAKKWKVKIKVTLEEDLTESRKKCLTLYELVQTFMKTAPELQTKLETINVQLDLAIKL